MVRGQRASADHIVHPSSFGGPIAAPARNSSMKFCRSGWMRIRMREPTGQELLDAATLDAVLASWSFFPVN